jgi:hypothetical protein
MLDSVFHITEALPAFGGRESDMVLRCVNEDCEVQDEVFASTAPPSSKIESSTFDAFKEGGLEIGGVGYG